MKQPVLPEALAVQGFKLHQNKYKILMRIIIPMAGWGSRLRPHTLTVPKPMVPVAGKSIVQRLVETLCETVKEPVEEIAFVIRRDFGSKVEEELMQISAGLKLKGVIKYQDEPLGTAHAILCAPELLTGKVIVAFADTLFRTDFELDTAADGVVWVQKVDDPSAFGVVLTNEQGAITDFVEKPDHFVSDLAIIGIYYFKDGDNLKKEMQYLLDNDIKIKGEYQLTTALENMKNKQLRFVPGQVAEWLDCGNKNATVYTNKRILELVQAKEQLISTNIVKENAIIIEPCYIADGVTLTNCVVGPHVSIGKDSKLENVVISNSMIQQKTSIKNKVLTNAMIGNNISIEGKVEDLSVGDYNSIQ
jgi:glucose-1-phosphate thymidylyltransferase